MTWTMIWSRALSRLFFLHMLPARDWIARRIMIRSNTIIFGKKIGKDFILRQLLWMILPNSMSQSNGISIFVKFVRKKTKSKIRKSGPIGNKKRSDKIRNRQISRMAHGGSGTYRGHPLTNLGLLILFLIFW